MPQIPATRSKTRIVGVVFILFGLALVGLNLYNGRYTATPQNELTMVTGKAGNVAITHIRRRLTVRAEVLSFTVQGQAVEYGADDTGYARLLQAVQHGEILTLGVAPHEESLIPHSGWAPLYTAAVGSQQVVRYEDAIAKRKSGSFALLLAAGVFLLIGAVRVFR